MKYWKVYDPSNINDRIWLKNLDKDSFVRVGVVTNPQNLRPYMMTRLKQTDDVILFPMIIALDGLEE